MIFGIFIEHPALPALSHVRLFDEHIPAPLNSLSVKIQRAANSLGRGSRFQSACELADLLRIIN
jgi:hypothetical protein